MKLTILFQHNLNTKTIWVITKNVLSSTESSRVMALFRPAYRSLPGNLKKSSEDLWNRWVFFQISQAEQQENTMGDLKLYILYLFFFLGGGGWGCKSLILHRDYQKRDLQANPWWNLVRWDPEVCFVAQLDASNEVVWAASSWLSSTGIGTEQPQANVWYESLTNQKPWQAGPMTSSLIQKIGHDQ